MNPFRWRWEHQVAFAITLLLGAGLGVLIELLQFDPAKWYIITAMMLDTPTGDVGEINGRLTAYSRKILLSAMLIGAASTGTIFYVVKLWNKGWRK